jgi:large subunit ribosomal protein L7/L12
LLELKLEKILKTYRLKRLLVSQTLDKLVEELSKLTVIEMAELKKMLEDKWGVKAAVASAPAAAVAEVVEESTEFDVILESSPADKKISVIKVVRELTGLGLKEAKDLVEGAPKTVKEKAAKAEAQDMVKKLTEAGAKAVAKGL